MSFSANSKVAVICATMLLFLHAQGQKNRTVVFDSGIDLSCCMETSTAQIHEPVRACYEQREFAFGACKVHAFIFETVSNISYCVDPKAQWLPSKLEELAASGINCTVL